jgi:hypothetical protein
MRHTKRTPWSESASELYRHEAYFLSNMPVWTDITITETEIWNLLNQSTEADDPFIYFAKFCSQFQTALIIAIGMQ